MRFPWLDEKFSMGAGLFVGVSKGTGGGAGELKVSEVRSLSVAGSPLGEDANHISCRFAFWGVVYPSFISTVPCAHYWKSDLFNLGTVLSPSQPKDI